MDKPSHLTFRLRTFTSDEIDAIIENSDNWRSLKARRRDALLSAMRAGRWDCGNGDVITFNGDGSLLNGQHRLNAAAIYQRETNDKVWFWCAMDVDKKAVVTMDQGGVRTLGEFIIKDGGHNANRCSTITMAQTRMAMAKDKWNLGPAVGSEYMVGRGKDGARSVVVGSESLQAHIDQWKRHKSAVIEWAEKVGKWHSAGLPRGAFAMALFFQLAKQKDMEAKLFYDYVVEGAGLKEGDPALTLRNRLLSIGRRETKVSRVAMGAIIVKAWVAWNRDESMDTQALRWRQFGPAAEGFPSHKLD